MERILAKTLLISGWLIFVPPTLAFRYLTFPFPGSQGRHGLRIAHRLRSVLDAAWISGGTLMGAGGFLLLRGSLAASEILAVAAAGTTAAGALAFYRLFSGASLFSASGACRFARGTGGAVPGEAVVLGVAAGGTAKAYPLNLLAYHHDFEDELDGAPLWVTYCAMCRAGRLFRPRTGGRDLHFRMVGTLRNNSVYQDRETGSWWHQATGEAVAGPLAGERLVELPADQVTLERWLQLHPASFVLQPNPRVGRRYRIFGLDRYDRDPAATPGQGPRWEWVVAVRRGGDARAWLWSLLTQRGLIEDRLGHLPLAVHLAGDGVSFRVWERRLGGTVLYFERDAGSGDLRELGSGTWFGFDGIGRGGRLDGARLRALPARQEYRHAFETFDGGVSADGGESP